MDWAKYTGQQQVVYARRPIELIVREKEVAHLRLMGGTPQPAPPSPELLPDLPMLDFSLRLPDIPQIQIPAIAVVKPTWPPYACECSVDLRVRSFIPGSTFFMKNGVITQIDYIKDSPTEPHRYHYHILFDDEATRELSYDVAMTWCKTIFPTDQALLPPQPGMHVQLYDEGRSTLYSGIIKTVDGGALDIVSDMLTHGKYFYVAKEAWLDCVWPDQLDGIS